MHKHNKHKEHNAQPVVLLRRVGRSMLPVRFRGEAGRTSEVWAAGGARGSKLHLEEFGIDALNLRDEECDGPNSADGGGFAPSTGGFGAKTQFWVYSLGISRCCCRSAASGF